MIRFSKSFNVKRCLFIAMLVVCLFSVSGCAQDYSGQYGGLSDEGIFISMTLNKDGTVQTNIIGIPLSGEYKVNRGILKITISVLGYSDSIQGRINGDIIEFADVTLKKGVTSVDISEVADRISSQNTTNKKNDSLNISAEETSVPQVDPKTRYQDAEKLFAIGRYAEAIEIYDEIADEIDVEERRAYAAECLDYCDTYFEWSNSYSGHGVTGGLKLDKYTGFGMEEIIIPYGVCGFSNYVFSDDNSAITKMVLPETMTEIPRGSLQGCPNLTDIKIPNSIVSLALDGTGIVEFTVPENVSTVPDGAFEDCNSLKQIVFPNLIKIDMGYGYPEGIFARCSSLKSVVLPDGMTTIPSRMFVDCYSLQSVHIPDTVTTIERSAFSGCRSLKTITIPESVNKIDAYAFENCVSLKSIKLPSSILELPERCFSGCISLLDVSLPDSLASIGDYAFSGCGNLRDLIIPKKLKSIDGYAFGFGNGDYDDIRDGLTLHVTKGTYGHRYGEENGISYDFETESNQSNSFYRLGNTVYLGEYEQNGNNADGKEPLAWIVLAEEEDQVLLISSFALDIVSNDAFQRWTTSFMINAFSPEEQNIIKQVKVLKRSEIEKYMPTDAFRQTVPTRFTNLKEPAYKRGNYWIDWWLGDSTNNKSVFVSSAGWIGSEGFAKEGIAIRPAIWIKKNNNLVSETHND